MTQHDNPERTAAPGDSPNDIAREDADRRQARAEEAADDPGPVPPEARPFTQYLGDSVYADFNGYAFVLTTENGYPDDPRNRIVLEPDIFSALVNYVARVRNLMSGGAR